MDHVFCVIPTGVWSTEAEQLLT